MDDDWEEEERAKAQALLYAKKLAEQEEKYLQRRKRIQELAETTFDFTTLVEEDLNMITPPYVDPVIPELSPQELNVSISRMLVAENPYYDIDRVIFNFQKGSFDKLLQHSREIVLFDYEGILIHVDSPEAVEQEERQEMEALWKEMIAQMNENTKQMIRERVQQKREVIERERIEREKAEKGDDESDEGEEEEEATSPKTSAVEEVVEPKQSTAKRKSASLRQSFTATMAPEEPKKKLPDKKLVNRFNYSDRSALTYDPVGREKTTQTVPVTRRRICAHVSQWIISDTYDKDFRAMEEQKEREKLAKMIMSVQKEDRTIRKGEKGEDPIFKRMAEGVLILERMINQNIYDNISQDCTFYEDPGDKYRPDEGALLPLWEFRYVAAKNVAVTEVKWNPAYKDLFGATFGMMDFTEPNNDGYVCVFTLKNPSYPEFVKHLDSGATSLDFHPRKCFYLCVGLHNGGVAVFNMQIPHCDTQYRSPVEINHRGMVASVLWCDDKRDRQLSFFSAGCDGKICKWLLQQSGLLLVPIITLYIDKHDLAPGCRDLELPANLTCLTFHPENFDIFMVGTALGTIYKCSTSRASSYFYQMKAHELPVHRISFNLYISDLFVTCSGDWRIKIWEDGRTEPLFLFNLENPVGDVQWAPYSSTIVAAITAVGRVYVYDLHIDKYEPACMQYVVCCDDSIATRLHFNPYGVKMPLILVGDSRGVVTTLKISPNLRVKPKPPKKTDLAVPVDDFTHEVKKLEKILQYVKEPIILELPNEEEMRQLVE